jgi:acetyl esterase
MVQYINWYFEDLNDMDHIYASPVLADLHDLPRTLVIAAEYDSLSEEDRQFAEKAEAAGVDTTYVLFPECQHGFTHEAFSREGFAEGAVAAALFADNLEGIHEFKDLIL